MNQQSLYQGSYIEILCKLLLRTSHQIRRETGRIYIIGGRLRGLKLKYEPDQCLTISSYGASVSIDSTEKNSWHDLLRLLVLHRVVD